jgi:flagellar motor switch protein FliN/FliY
MAEDMDFESFEKLDDLDWSQLEDEAKKSGGEAKPAGAGAAPAGPGADANAAKVGVRSDKFIDINYLLDVNLQITVEVGRKQAYISQVLAYDHGSIVELERLVGEPLDLLVNKKRVARGEVVVVNEKFAIKITEILDPKDRLAQIMP